MVEKVAPYAQKSDVVNVVEVEQFDYNRLIRRAQERYAWTKRRFCSAYAPLKVAV